ncbi:GNAT family N-acetyltransferase [Alteromonas sp. ASW11-19]|uniref:GNAT family N-acetyltransferase n=1 Tax=Alteromonas salexigens TaxID=2982530 RepID=A0ABT2VQA2_9ALTE|nr:GNAT family N-acetyltransferase [Alteromonas salexigens]MCU7555053.1 GNAT family N-acetyltransferase [Alteromonas salexigens]
MGLRVRFINHIGEVTEEHWQRLSNGCGPFLTYQFLRALEDSHSVGGKTGWQPYHLLIENEAAELVAAMPGYLKSHSYGEYVFDHAWADAYHQHGRAYYPKWISAVPFTPVTGPRLLHADGYPPEALQASIEEAMATLAAEGCSSAHVLFAPSATSSVLPQHFATRYSVQFQWHNYQYRHNDDFLAALTSRKRKSVRKAYAQIQQQDVELTTLAGDDINDEDMAFFYQCYQRTYLKRSGHTGYLTKTFFDLLYRQCRSSLMLVTARQHGEPVASALFLHDSSGLYGRYWGSLKDIDGLHFVCCYFEGIWFAIKHQLPLFNPGTQGEHKILRGFEPVLCRSFHHLFAAEYHHAVADYLHRETPAVFHYFNQALDVLPFNADFKNALNAVPIELVADGNYNNNE